jgi:hypothetical protein
MMDMGGFRSGTALTAVGRQLLGGKMGKPTAEEMERIGILRKGMWHKLGTGVVTEPDALVGEDILKDSNKGVSAWFNQVLLPAFAKLGMTSNADIQQELYRVFGTETARRLAGLYIQNHAQVDRDAKLYDNALGGEAYGNIVKGDLGANIKNLSDSFTNFLQAFGAPLVPVAISALQSVSGAMNDLTGIVMAHPTAFKLAGEALAGVAIGLSAFGAVAVVGALAAWAPGGLAAAGAIGIRSAIIGLAALNWNSVSEGLAGVRKSLDGFINGVLGTTNGAPGTQRSPLGGTIPSAHDLIQKQSYHPGSDAKGSDVHVHLHVDGQEVAQMVTRVQMADALHPTRAPYFDSYAGYSPPDQNVAWG